MEKVEKVGLATFSKPESWTILVRATFSTFSRFQRLAQKFVEKLGTSWPRHVFQARSVENVDKATFSKFSSKLAATFTRHQHLKTFRRHSFLTSKFSEHLKPASEDLNNHNKYSHSAEVVMPTVSMNFGSKVMETVG